jgi:hypothetical protein
LLGIVGNDEVRAIKSFFALGCFLGEVNATSIAQIPKVPKPWFRSSINLMVQFYAAYSLLEVGFSRAISIPYGRFNRSCKC